MIALLLLPCIAWLVLAALALRSVLTIPRLSDVAAPAPPSWPVVSVIVPACNEARTLPAAAATLAAQDYPALQLVFVDDRSSDTTGKLIDDLAARDERVDAVHVDTLPTGWLGKPHALQRGLDVARGDWLLFTDADVHLAAGTLRLAIAWCEAEGVDHLALLPDMVADGFALQATVASFGRYFALGQRLWKVNDDEHPATVGVGAFNLVRRAALERTEGLAWLALDATDDLALARLLQVSGARGRVLWGLDSVSVRWYGSLGEMAVGLEKNTYPMAGCRLWRVALAALAVLALDWPPLLILFWPGLPSWLRLAAGGTLAACLLASAWVSRLTRRPILPGLAIPLGATLVAAILLRAGVLGALRGGVRWRGTFYSSELLRRGARVTMF